MDTIKLIYAQHDYLTNTVKNLTLAQKRHLEIFTSRITYDLFLTAPRGQHSLNPFNFYKHEKFNIPAFKKINLTFSEATDSRAKEIAELCSSNELPIVVCWSGGIDSTVILSAIVKNFTQKLKDRVVVMMNNASYFENPYFYENIIKKEKFTIVNKCNYGWSEANIIVGEPADALWIQADIVELDLLSKGSFQFDLIKNPDLLINFLADKSSHEHARWLYEMILQDSKANGFELNSYEDFYWWLKFNFCYSGNCFHVSEFADAARSNIFNLDLFQTTLIPWYHSDEYQLWSMNNCSNGVKYQGGISSYKMPAKEYIYSVDGNSRYRDFKTKVGSTKVSISHISAAYTDNIIYELSYNL